MAAVEIQSSLRSPVTWYRRSTACARTGTESIRKYSVLWCGRSRLMQIHANPDTPIGSYRQLRLRIRCPCAYGRSILAVWPVGLNNTVALIQCIYSMTRDSVTVKNRDEPYRLKFQKVDWIRWIEVRNFARSPRQRDSRDAGFASPRPPHEAVCVSTVSGISIENNALPCRRRPSIPISTANQQPRCELRPDTLPVEHRIHTAREPANTSAAHALESQSSAKSPPNRPPHAQMATSKDAKY